MRAAILASLVTALALAPFAPVSSGQSSQLFNTQVATGNGPYRSGAHWYLAEDESTRGVDRNGDGDLADRVTHVVDSAAHTVSVIPLAAQKSSSNLVREGGDFQVIPVSEADHFNADLNGDGAVNDTVLFFRRISTGVITVVPLAIQSFSIAADGSVASAVVIESFQGADLNADGDFSDTLIVRIVPGTSTWTVISPIYQVPTVQIALNGGDILFDVREVFVSIDANGDGDKNDDVLRLWRAASGSFTNLPLTNANAAWNVTVTPSQNAFVYAYREGSQGVGDLNGDGDTLDFVPVIVDRATLAFTSSHGAVDQLETDLYVALDDQYLVTQVHEASQGADLNGDGDTNDKIPFVTTLATGVTASCGEAIELRSEIVMGTGWFAYLIVENFTTPQIDVNGDGDTFDAIPIVRILAPGVAGERIPIPHAVQLQGASSVQVRPLRAVGTQLAITVDESLNNLTDFDYDSDGVDQVPFVFDVPSRRMMNLACAQSGLSLSKPGATLLAVTVYEAANNNHDLNGDGDALDAVTSVYDSRSGALLNAGFATFYVSASAANEMMIWAWEAGQSADLNGNGNQNDIVNVLYTPTALGCGAFELYGNGCATSEGRVPQLEAHGCAQIGGPIRLQVRGAIVGQCAFLVLGNGRGNAPLGGGCTLLVSPLLPFAFGPIFLPSNGMMGGAVALDTIIPPGSVPGSICVQAIVSDPGLPKGFAATNGLELTIVP